MQDKKSSSEGDFWTLPAAKTKSYRPPSFEGRTTDTVPVESADAPVEAGSEKIPPADRTAPIPRPVRQADRLPSSPYRTSVYSGDGYSPENKEKRGWNTGESGKYADFNAIPAAPKAKSTAGEILCDRSGDGWLLKRITVRRWINDFAFYGRFGHDAEISHSQIGKPEDGAEPVPFFSYVPQYSQMNSRQLGFYLWFRDQVRNGVCPEGDMAYVLLYVFEILNLPHRIPPEEGILLLCRLWVHYRKVYPRLDSCLCEWVPDYSLIHQVPLPEMLSPILPEIVRKAQFKEFYLDFIREANRRDGEMLADILLEAYSDYDYRKSRYYNTNKDAYETEIRGALLAVLLDAWEKKRDMFRLERTYRLTRDAYCGAIAQTDVKRRIDVSFTSCIRSPETRKFITDIVKYAENLLRLRLRIKSKLGADGIAPEDKAIVDRYFGDIPSPVGSKVQSKAPEAEYLKQYEADSVGFDIASAGAIEAASWTNTSRLTEDLSFAPSPSPEETEAEEDTSPYIPGELTEEVETVIPSAADSVPSEETADESADTFPQEKAAVAALLAGNYAAFCRERGLFPGQMADRINEIFLDLLGDILVEDSGNGTDFHIIADYRKDAETWSRI